jgi:hypothetical protein
MTTEFVQKNNYEATQLEDEWIILNTDNYSVTKLNELGGYCWSLLREVQTVNSLLQAVEEKYQFTGGAVEKDIELFLEDLIQYGLVKDASR